jgi:hypothetical protein
MVQMASKQTPLETIAVCDLWKLARERRAARYFNLDPKCYQYSEEMLANTDRPARWVPLRSPRHLGGPIERSDCRSSGR